MNEVTIEKDGKVKILKKYLMGLPLIVALTSFSWALGFSTTSLIAGGVVGAIVWFILIKNRTSWGQSITFTDMAMYIENAEGNILIVEASKITSAEIKPSAIIISWSENDGSKSLVIGRESFLEQTWSRLVSLFGEFAPSELTERA